MPWTGPRRLRELLDAEEGRDRYMVDNELLIVDPTQLSDEEIASCKSDLELIFKAIKNVTNDSALESTLESDKRYTSMDPTAAHIIAEVCGADLQLPEDAKEGERLNMVQGIIDIRNDGADEFGNDLLDLLADSGTLPPETVSNAREEPQLTAKTMASLMQQRLSSAEQERNAAEQKLQRGAQELLKSGWAIAAIAGFFGTTEEQVEGWLDKSVQSSRD